ncbi:TrkA family potassium uptake protein [Halalkalibacterium halodurans]|jgi:trk system potassium uptake protein TrkA|uniref:Potassium transporter Trk n=2 Tax=Halalkalibacterium halodurans TaxID=86665 RepID=A0A0M0KDP5_ALKHA|nr:TrkA family potassium uptake protein [Halalkalibacterium halodurans]MDY7221091.1 TrkA family potassium uptake protein [Halalkalibacterium halodurans]MDY7240330.1 TrkA family potassium uptake protein [Halalkalibacterium halodurans]MED3645589.1 TrkA family potassium uptake protein [Halalkalibacterium halodurans]MED4083141.1 TrkA family potassium uptake protein [Halalkalibacterium halodurans]MED4086025.1 TrkA family potassium uptake protein [Halalkalibacterium halodurans]
MGEKELKMKTQFAVIGLGRFGGSVCRELYQLGHEVLAIDTNESKVNEFTTHATHTVIANATDEKALTSLGIRNFDHVVVAIGDNIQSSVLCTLLLKELGVPNVWVKAQNDYHHRVLEKIGADRIVHPEQDMGIRIAQHLSSEKIIDYIELSDEYSIVELVATSKVADQTLADLDIRATYGATVLAIKSGEHMNVSPLPTDIIRLNDILIVIGHNNDLNRFEREGL